MLISDGCGVQRCEFCHAPIKAAGDYPLVTIRQSDAEEIACILEQYVDCPEVWGDTIKRLEQACGRTVRQMNDAEREKRLTDSDGR
jgi:hypothetical protein